MELSAQVPLRFEGHGTRLYYPGETLAGSYSLTDYADEAIEAVEVSVLWRTEGKGNEDFRVHAFWRRSLKAGDWIDPRTGGRFSVTLPNSPLSYEGELVKIYWVVRIRLYLADGRQEIAEHPFRLGNVSSIRMLRELHSTEEADDRHQIGLTTEILQ